MSKRLTHVACWMACALLVSRSVHAEEELLFTRQLDVTPKPIASDPSVRYDFDLVYVRAARAGDVVHKRYYTDIATPLTLEPGADLMLLHPDGTEELLVAGGEGAVTDPVVSFDGEWVYYTLIYSMRDAGPWQPPLEGADIYKIHVPTRRIVRLTDQEFTPNLGAAEFASGFRQPSDQKTWFNYGVLNFGPCPLPDGRIAFTSNRNGFRPPRAYPTVAMQLFVMDDDGTNVEQIGYLNVAGALHPVVLQDGRIIFSSLESQGVRSEISWGIWSIHPDGTNWGPVVSAFDRGGASNAFHFQTQLGDGSIIVEEYYNQNNSGFGAYFKLPSSVPDGYPPFGPADVQDPRNPPFRFGRFDNGKGKWYQLPFSPRGAESLTPFATNGEGPADSSVVDDPNSPKVGKFTHPSAAPDNHLLTIWSPGPVNHQYTFLPQLDGGIYLIKQGRVIDEPGQMLLIKNDPRYNEQWPRALVPYRRIHGIDEPRRVPELANDGLLSKHLPSGTPFGLVGSSSLYKRESYPNGAVAPGTVTASFAHGDDPWKGLDAFTSHGNGMPLNWHNQGADAGLYSNEEIHALRILAMEPTTDRHRGPRSGRLFHSHAQERLRILGEIPVRKFQHGQQPLDPDGNPDTSFLALIPADTAFTFQTLDAQGMVLNMAQTWHQLRPGEVRHDCGGCHAHSQQPTPFEETLAGKPEYQLWDLAHQTPLLTSNAGNSSTLGRDPATNAAAGGKGPMQWDVNNSTSLRFSESGPLTVEYFRDVLPIFQRSCVACHTESDSQPAGNLVLDADARQIDLPNVGQFPATYYRLALDEAALFGYKPVGWDSWGYPQASRYVRKFQSRRSLLTWKIFGRRLDGFSNDDHPSEDLPGSGRLVHHGQELEIERHRHRFDVDFTGEQMPPRAAVEGTYVTPTGRTIRVPPLDDEDRRTIVRWIDLGCPLDLDHETARSGQPSFGWLCDDQRPTLALSRPRRMEREPLTALVVGMFDGGSGLDLGSLEVVADFEVCAQPPGTNLASRFKPAADGVWRLDLDHALQELPSARLVVSVRDRQGNLSRVDRRFELRGKP